MLSDYIADPRVRHGQPPDITDYRTARMEDHGCCEMLQNLGATRVLGHMSDDRCTLEMHYYG